MSVIGSGDEARAPHRRIRRALIAALAIAALAGCTPTDTASAPAVTNATHTTASASPAAATPLTCGDLVTAHDLTAAFASGGSSGQWTATPVSVADGDLLGDSWGGLPVEGAGGLQCAWQLSADGSRADAKSGLVVVAVLPNAASDWSAMLYGDGPTSQRHTFAGISAAAGCGDPGCGASAKVGSSWVRVDFAVNGLARGTSPFGTRSDDAILQQLDPAISSVFRTVAAAGTAQLTFPAHLAHTRHVDCASFLPESRLADALGVASASYGVRWLRGESDSVSGAASHRIGTIKCSVLTGSVNNTGVDTIEIAPGQAWAVAATRDDPLPRISVLDSGITVTSTTLAGAADGETALTVDGTARPDSILFTLGTDAISVNGTRTDAARKVAEAILAYAR